MFTQLNSLSPLPGKERVLQSWATPGVHKFVSGTLTPVMTDTTHLSALGRIHPTTEHAHLNVYSMLMARRADEEGSNLLPRTESPHQSACACTIQYTLTS